MIVSKAEEIAWVAGLVEGEGSFSLHKHKNRNPQARASLLMTDEEPIRRLHRIMGTGTVNGPYLPKKGTKPYWVWSVMGHARVLAVILQLWPWLGPRRQHKAVKVIKGCAIKGKQATKDRLRAQSLAAIIATEVFA